MNIGKRITVTNSRNAQFIGKSGIIEDETKHTITINGTQLIKEHITIEETP